MDTAMSNSITDEIITFGLGMVIRNELTIRVYDMGTRSSNEESFADPERRITPRLEKK